jgi:hypothetical protein
MRATYRQVDESDSWRLGACVEGLDHTDEVSDAYAATARRRMFVVACLFALPTLYLLGLIVWVLFDMNRKTAACGVDSCAYEGVALYTLSILATVQLLHTLAWLLIARLTKLDRVRFRVGLTTMGAVFLLVPFLGLASTALAGFRGGYLMVGLYSALILALGVRALAGLWPRARQIQ